VLRHKPMPERRAALPGPLRSLHADRGRQPWLADVGFDGTTRKKNPEIDTPALAASLAALEPGAAALDNALRVQGAERLSVTDDLTRLYNSRYRLQVLARETKRASRSGGPFSLLFIDPDGSKAVDVSVGMVTLPDVSLSADGSIRAADSALYFVKDRGKNGIHVAG